MKKAFLTHFFAALMILLMASCGSDKPATIPEKIEFPTIDFGLNPNRDTTFFGPQGTRIFIEAGTFQLADGSPATDSITVQLKEFYDKSDIVLGNLSTRSGDQLLETAGMIYLDAKSKGQKLEIKPGKQVVVHFPKKEDDYQEMNLFYADDTAGDSSVSNWEIDTVKLFKKTLSLAGYGWWYPDVDDSTSYDFKPRNFVDTGYYWNPLDFYVRSFDFSEATIKALEKSSNRNDYPYFDDWNGSGVECELVVSEKGYIKNIKINTNIPSYARKEILRFLRGLPRLESGKNKYGDIIERRGLLLIRSGDIVPIYKTSEGYVKSFDQKYKQFEKSPIQSMDDAELNYYVFSITKLGWINCDRFYEVQEKVDVLAEIQVSPNTKLMMAFGDIDAVLAPDIANGKYVFPNVPIGRPVTIIGIKNENGKFKTAFQQTTTTAQPIRDLVFQETTLTKLREDLKGI